MNFPPKSSLWHAGIIPAPIETLTDPAAVLARRGEIVWLPNPGPWRYLADPFGVRRADATHVFVEAYDYRTKHGVIEHHELSPALCWRRKVTCLAGPCHLSYPYIVEHAGEVFMVPETHSAREVVLYRAHRFPDCWTRETVLLSDVPAADATLARCGEHWWMFFTVVGPDASDRRWLHMAYAEQLTGPWRLHHRNPIRDDRAGARPGGSPWVDAGGALMLPVQDCSRSYGGGIRFLRFATLTPDEIVVERVGDCLTGTLVSGVYVDGFHTLSACGDLTLFDAKRIVRSMGRYAVDLQRLATRHFRRKSWYSA